MTSDGFDLHPASCRCQVCAPSSTQICDHDKCCRYFLCAHPQCCGYRLPNGLTVAQDIAFERLAQALVEHPIPPSETGGAR